MSYYSSKHPGLYLYLALVAVTLYTFLFQDISPAHIGVLSILWGVFTALRALSLYEINAYYSNYAQQSTQISKEHNGQSSALAHDLMRRMSGSANMKQGLHALYCLHERTILWFALALGYTAYYLQTSAPIMSKSALMETICTLFMIGTAFWGGQSYAHNRKASKLILFTFTIALALSLYSLPIEMSAVQILNTFSGASILQGGTSAILLVLALYSVSILLYALLQRDKAALSALGGITLIGLLGICHMMLEPSQANTALWISGWGLFSVFWTRAYQPVSKRYVLYQCD